LYFDEVEGLCGRDGDLFWHADVQRPAAVGATIHIKEDDSFWHDEFLKSAKT